MGMSEYEKNRNIFLNNKVIKVIKYGERNEHPDS